MRVRSHPSIDIRQEHLAPFHVRFFGLLLFIIGILGFSVSLVILLSSGASDWLLWASLPLAAVGAFIFYSHYRLQIDIRNRTYTIVTKMPFFRSGQPQKFDHISKIYINSVRETTTYTTRAALRHDITVALYKAFMKLDSGEKIHMDTDKDLDRLQQRTDQYISALGDIYRPS